MSKGTDKSDELRFAVMAYVVARAAHVGAARSALLRAVDDAGRGGGSGPAWADGEIIAPDGISLTVGGDMPDGTVRWQHKMPTAIELERAERALAEAARADTGDDAELREAALDLLAELREPWHGYRPDVAAEVERSRARTERHSAVFDRLCAAAGVWP